MTFLYRFDFTVLFSYGEMLWRGFWVTIKLSISAMMAATVLAIIFGIATSRENKAIKSLSLLVMDVLRSIPILILLLICYYSLPILGIYVAPIVPAFIALSLDAGAFLGDVFRGSILGLPKGSLMAAKALGMSPGLTLRRIILPEMVRETLPTIILMYIGLIRTSSLASIIAVSELTHTGGWIISSTYKPLEVYGCVGLLYVLAIAPLMMISRWLEGRPFFKRRAI